MSREQFEAWMTAEQWFHGSDFEWDDRRNCYSQFGIHLAYKAWQAATKQAEAKFAALAAENAGLKESEVPLGAIENGRAFADRLEVYPFECEGGNLNMCSDWQEFRRCFEHISEWAMHGQSETPATDAFLAEVRASTADEACLKISNAIVNCYQDEQIGLDAAATICGDFAAQLRQEAAQ